MKFLFHRAFALFLASCIALQPGSGFGASAPSPLRVSCTTSEGSEVLLQQAVVSRLTSAYRNFETRFTAVPISRQGGIALASSGLAIWSFQRPSSLLAQVKDAMESSREWIRRELMMKFSRAQNREPVRAGSTPARSAPARSGPGWVPINIHTVSIVDLDEALDERIPGLRGTQKAGARRQIAEEIYERVLSVKDLGSIKALRNAMELNEGAATRTLRDDLKFTGFDLSPRHRMILLAERVLEEPDVVDASPDFLRLRSVRYSDLINRRSIQYLRQTGRWGNAKRELEAEAQRVNARQVSDFIGDVVSSFTRGPGPKSSVSEKPVRERAARELCNLVIMDAELVAATAAVVSLSNLNLSVDHERIKSLFAELRDNRAAGLNSGQRAGLLRAMAKVVVDKVAWKLYGGDLFEDHRLGDFSTSDVLFGCQRLISTNKARLEQLRRQLVRLFGGSDIGFARFIIGTETQRTADAYILRMDVVPERENQSGSRPFKILMPRSPSAQQEFSRALEGHRYLHHVNPNYIGDLYDTAHVDIPRGHALDKSHTGTAVPMGMAEWDEGYQLLQMDYGENEDRFIRVNEAGRRVFLNEEETRQIWKQYGRMLGSYALNPDNMSLTGLNISQGLLAQKPPAGGFSGSLRLRMGVPLQKQASAAHVIAQHLSAGLFYQVPAPVQQDDGRNTELTVLASRPLPFLEGFLEGLSGSGETQRKDAVELIRAGLEGAVSHVMTHMSLGTLGEDHPMVQRTQQVTEFLTHYLRPEAWEDPFGRHAHEAFDRARTPVRNAVRYIDGKQLERLVNLLNSRDVTGFVGTLHSPIDASRALSWLAAAANGPDALRDAVLHYLREDKRFVDEAWLLMPETIARQIVAVYEQPEFRQSWGAFRERSSPYWPVAALNPLDRYVGEFGRIWNQAQQPGPIEAVPGSLSERAFDWKSPAGNYQAPAQPLPVVGIGSQIPPHQRTRLHHWKSRFKAIATHIDPSLADVLREVDSDNMFLKIGALEAVPLDRLEHRTQDLKQRLSEVAQLAETVDITIGNPTLVLPSVDRSISINFEGHPQSPEDLAQLAHMQGALGLPVMDNDWLYRIPVFYATGLTARQHRSVIKAISQWRIETEQESLEMTVEAPQIIAGESLDALRFMPSQPLLAKRQFGRHAKTGYARLSQLVRSQLHRPEMDDFEIRGRLSGLLGSFPTLPLWSVNSLAVALETGRVTENEIRHRLTLETVQVGEEETLAGGIRLIRIQGTDRPGLLLSVARVVEHFRGSLVTVREEPSSAARGRLTLELMIEGIDDDRWEITRRVLSAIPDMPVPAAPEADIPEAYVSVQVPNDPGILGTVLQALWRLDRRASVRSLTGHLVGQGRAFLAFRLRLPFTVTVDDALSHIRSALAGGTPDEAVAAIVISEEAFRAHLTQQLHAFVAGERSHQLVASAPGLFTDDEIVAKLSSGRDTRLATEKRSLERLLQSKKRMWMDLDNCLVDSNKRDYDARREAKRFTMQKIAERRKVAPLSARRLEPHLHLTVFTWPAMLRDMGLGHLALNEFVLGTMERIYQTRLGELMRDSHPPALDGLRDFVENLGVPVDVVTSDESNAEVVLEKAGLREFFGSVHVMESAKRSDPGVLQTKMQEWMPEGVSAEDQVFFSDSVDDLREAKARGMTTIAVVGPLLRVDDALTRLRYQQLLDYADYVIVNFEGLVFRVKRNAPPGISGPALVSPLSQSA